MNQLRSPGEFAMKASDLADEIRSADQSTAVLLLAKFYEEIYADALNEICGGE